MIDQGGVERVSIVAQQFSDAEIEQFRLALVRYQNVGRLQVAMDDQIAMRKMHGAADL